MTLRALRDPAVMACFLDCTEEEALYTMGLLAEVGIMEEPLRREERAA